MVNAAIVPGTGLDTWAEENAVALRRLLTTPFGRDRKPAKAGQRIVFDEWLQATHSKAYDKLPARFIVVDIFDTELRGRHVDLLFVSACRLAFSPCQQAYYN